MNSAPMIQHSSAPISRRFQGSGHRLYRHGYAKKQPCSGPWAPFIRTGLEGRTADYPSREGEYVLDFFEVNGLSTDTGK